MDKDEQRKYKKERYDWLKEHGICVCCGHEPTYKGLTKCIYCRAVQNAATAEYNRLHPDTPEQRENKRVRSYNLREERKKAGLCPWCGKPVDSEKIHCGRCLAKMKQYTKARSERDGRIPREIGMELGLCCWCLREPVLQGKKLCKICYEKAVISAENARKHINIKNHSWRIKDHVIFEEFKLKKNGGNCHVGESTENGEMPAE